MLYGGGAPVQYGRGVLAAPVTGPSPPAASCRTGARALTDDRLAALVSGPHVDPGAVAVMLPDGPVTFGDLDRLAGRAAAGLAGLGAGAGDRIAVWLPNGIEWLALWLACGRLGAIAVAVNTRFRGAETGDIIGRSEARILALAPGFRGIDFRGILADVDPAALDRIGAVIACGDGDNGEILPGRRTVAWADLVVDDGPDTAPDTAPGGAPGHADAGCVVFTTSGTTSAPKFVLHRQRSLTRHARDVARGFGYDAADTVLLQALPLCGTFGLAQAAAALAAGRPMVMLPAWDAAAAARLITRHCVTGFNGTDVMFAELLDAAAPDDLSSLRICGYAAFANPESADLVQAGDRRGVPFVGLYGMSEVQALYARQAVDASAADRARAGGHPTSPDAAFRVVDPETGVECPAGVDGELQFSGPSRFAEYLDDPEATARALTADGFVRSGDLGHRAADGGFVFRTRMGDSLRLGGFLVSPGEIDAWVERHPAVAACQTVGVPGPRGARPVSFVIPAAGVAFDEARVIDHCARGLARFKVPLRVLPLDEFPVTTSANGVKIRRNLLRDMAAAQLPPGVGGRPGGKEKISRR